MGRLKLNLTNTEIQKRSDEKRGVKVKAFKLPLSVISDIELLSKQYNLSQSQLIAEAIDLIAEKYQNEN